MVVSSMMLMKYHTHASLVFCLLRKMASRRFKKCAKSAENACLDAS